MLGVYIHIPFCDKLCSYCDFCKMLYKKEYVSKYLKSLKQEIEKRYLNEYIDSIYIGGGTPSSLSLKELEELLDILKTFKLKDKYEYTIECNIENINEEKLKLYKKYNINRISYGVESFNDNHLKILNRNHTKKKIKDTIEITKKYFDNINIDLIYGVTNNKNILMEDINNFLELDIPHISCYSLILEEHTKLYIDNHKYIDEDTDIWMFDYINNTLTKNNYKHYEISNYAKEGYESIHNKNYWLNGYYYGFGLSAVSYLNNYRISNTKNMTKYLNNIYEENKIFESINIQKENDLILGFRLIDGININTFNKKYNTNILNIKTIKKLLEDNLLVLEKNNLKCNYKYIYVINEILTNIIGSDLS